MQCNLITPVTYPQLTADKLAQVLFLTIMAQLYAPLNSFSSNYRNVRAL